MFLDLRLRAIERGYDLTFVGLAVEEDVHDTSRAYGRYYPDRRLVTIAPELLEARDTMMRGVMAHEIGHACVMSGLVPSRAGSYDEEEREADRAAKAVLGLTIYYGPDGVQRAGHGARGVTPRPAGLR